MTVAYNLEKFCFVFLMSLFYPISSLDIEELKAMNYAVEISSIPVKESKEQTHAVYMTSKYGQSYQCMLPQNEDDEVDEKERVKEMNADIKELLKPLNSGKCLIKGKDWWTYEICFGRYVKQFHIDDGRIVGQVITLGHFESDYDWSNEANQEKFNNVKQRYHSQYYVNGTTCDLTGHPRNAEVRIFCDESTRDYISRVDEPGTCSYVITIHSRRLCLHPSLRPIPSKKSLNIPCHPVLNEHQYSMYMKEFNEKKELENLKENEPIKFQSDPVHIMKKEVLDGLIAEDIATLKKNNEEGASEESEKDLDKKKSFVDDIDISYLKKLIANKRRQNLEKAVKEKLEKAGIEGGKIEVKIIQAGYIDNDGKWYDGSDVENGQFQQTVLSLLNRHRDAALEMERHKKQEDNYKFTMETNSEGE